MKDRVPETHHRIHTERYQPPAVRFEDRGTEGATGAVLDIRRGHLDGDAHAILVGRITTMVVLPRGRPRGQVDDQRPGITHARSATWASRRPSTTWPEPSGRPSVAV